MRVIARMKAACPPGIPAWSPARNAAVACTATACSCTSSVLPLEVAPPFRRSLFRANRHRRISPCRPAADAKHSRLRCRRRHCPLPPRGRNAACPAFHIQKPAQIVNYFVDNSCPEFMTILSTSSMPECGVASKGLQWPTSPTATVACGVRADTGTTRFMAATHLANATRRPFSLVHSGTDDHGRHRISESRNEDGGESISKGMPSGVAQLTRAAPPRKNRRSCAEPDGKQRSGSTSIAAASRAAIDVRPHPQLLPDRSDEKAFAQRVKLWALPASTLMMLPVDLADMSEARK